MNPSLKRKLRNWIIIYAAVAAVIFVVKLGGKLLGIETNPSALAILVGGGIWYMLEGEAKFAEIRRKYGKNKDTEWE
mgnify:CR=1 FL=1